MVIMSIFGFVAFFELMEWFYAELAAPDKGSAFLGSQGDIWDVQKDMFCNGLGAIFASFLYCLIKPKKLTCSNTPIT